MRGWEGAAKYEDNFLGCAEGRLRRDRWNATIGHADIPDRILNRGAVGAILPKADC